MCTHDRCNQGSNPKDPDQYIRCMKYYRRAIWDKIHKYLGPALLYPVTFDFGTRWYVGNIEEQGPSHPRWEKTKELRAKVAAEIEKKKKFDEYHKRKRTNPVPMCDVVSKPRMDKQGNIKRLDCGQHRADEAEYMQALIPMLERQMRKE